MGDGLDKAADDFLQLGLLEPEELQRGRLQRVEQAVAPHPDPHRHADDIGHMDDLCRLADSKSPDGRAMVMPLKPVRKLIIKTAQQSANGSSTSSSESFVAEHAGRLVIPVPSAK